MWFAICPEVRMGCALVYRVKGSATDVMASQSSSYGESERRQRVWGAIERLTDQELLKLRRFATLRLSALGSARNGRQWNDVLQDAILSVASGHRQWPEKIDLFTLLVGTVRSLTDARSGRGRDSAKSLGDLPEVNFATSADSSPESRAIFKERLDMLLGTFANDSCAHLILEGWLIGLSGPEIRQAYELSARDFGAAAKRISRKIERMQSE
ncbi:MAG TPA: hypothetical protein VGG72_20245 [Bryobacteraceae bacterium]|jgi:DNA-directed RNA polymerase specialized sigma24 family protein